MIEYFTHPSVVHKGKKIFANSVTNVLIIMRAHMTRRDGLTQETTVESLIIRGQSLQTVLLEDLLLSPCRTMKEDSSMSGSTPEEDHNGN